MAELGLKGTFRERVFEPLLKVRGADGGPGFDVSLEAFMGEEWLGMKNDKGEYMTKRDLYLEMGAMPWETTLNALIHRQDDFRFLAGEVIRDMVVEGLQADGGVTAWYQQLCLAVGEPVGAMTATTPRIQFKDAGPAEVEEGETLPLAKITTAERGVRCTKKGRTIELTDEVVKSCPMNLLAPYLAEVNATIIAQENDHVVDTQLNGDQRSGGDEAAVVGIATQNTLIYDDIDNVWIFGADINQQWFDLVTNRETAKIVRKLPEFREQQGQGGTRVTLKAVNDIEPSTLPHFISRRMPDKKLMFVNRNRATRQVVFMPLQVEDARYPERMVSAVTVATITGYENVNRRARIVIDIEKAFAQYGFPAEWEKVAA